MSCSDSQTYIDPSSTTPMNVNIMRKDASPMERLRIHIIRMHKWSMGQTCVEQASRSGKRARHHGASDFIRSRPRTTAKNHRGKSRGETTAQADSETKGHTKTWKTTMMMSMTVMTVMPEVIKCVSCNHQSCRLPSQKKSEHWFVG